MELKLCRLCHVPIQDSEPLSRKGEWFHKTTGCQNSGKHLDERDLVDWVLKRDRRATVRGAKLARKLRS